MCQAGEDSGGPRAWPPRAYDDSSELLPRAAVDQEAHAAFWLCGIIPRCWTEVAAPRDHDLWALLDGQQAAVLAPGALGQGTEEAPLVLFGDASGGPEGQDPHLRRVGLA
eukprot:7716548-Pyramimonas_sp.AAC.1